MAKIKKKVLGDFDYLLYLRVPEHNVTWFIEEVIDGEFIRTESELKAKRFTFAKANSVNRQLFKNNMNIKKINKLNG